MNLMAALKQVIYTQVSAECLTMRNAKTGGLVSEVAQLAIAHGAPRNILGVGAQARHAAAFTPSDLVKPFAHPRSLVSDFSAGEQLLKAFLKRVRSTSLFAASPTMVVHLLGEPAGGFTQVEVRAFREMALGAGAAQVHVWQGCVLTDQQLLTGTFPSSGTLLA
jgi:rod shape-determining protein MreB